jgi:hypothetical protein
VAKNEGDRQWIVEPAPGQVALHLAFGDGVQLTKEQEAAVGELLRTLEAGDPEVTGHALRGGTCTKLSCHPVNCDLKCGTLKAVTAGGGGSWSLMGTFGGIA